MPLEPTTVPPAKGPPAPPEYVPAVPPPTAAPPSGLLARLRAWRAGARGAAFGRDVVVDVARGARLEIGAGAAIGAGTRLHVRAGTVRIGEEAIVGERCVLAAHAGIELGPGAVLGDEAVIVDFAHRHDDPELPIRLQGVAAAPVAVGAGARIGPRAAIQPGVTIGERAEVGPLAVVSTDVPSGARVGGVPALSPSGRRRTRGGSPSRRGR